MHKGEDLDCKVLSVMMRHFNFLKYYVLNILANIMSWPNFYCPGGQGFEIENFSTVPKEICRNCSI